ncbi:MAG: TonB-dependent siderophore receptor [Pseudomonadota bacterium]
MSIRTGNAAWAIARRTAIVGIAIATTFLATETQAASAEIPEPTAQSAELDALQTFDIPAQPLTSALALFGQQSGLQVTADGALIRNANAPDVRGTMTSNQALRLLLSQTDLTYSIVDGTTVSIRQRGQSDDDVLMLDPITVEGQGQTAFGPVDGFVADRSSTGSKTDTPISEVPQSISVITEDQIDALGARTVGDALAYTAGVTTGTRGDSSGLGGDNIAIRGFGGDGTAGASDNEYWDGLRVQGTQFAVSSFDPFFYERLEVLRGPASVLYGQNQPGGIVNRISKLPPDEAQGEVMLRGGTFDTIELGVDLGGPLTDDADLTYRLVGILSDQNAQTQFTGRKREAFAPSFTWRATPDTTLTILTAYQHDDIDGGFVKYLPSVGTVFDSQFGKIPRDRFAGDPNYDKWIREFYALGYVFEHQFDDTWSFRQNARYTHNDLDFESVFISSLQADERTANRSAFGAVEHSDAYALDTQAQAVFDTGALSHTFLFGIDLQRNNSDTLRRFSAAPTLDLYDPVYYQTIPQPPVFQNLDFRTEQIGLYAQDQIKFENWIFTFGGRQDWAESKTTNNLTGGITSQDDNKFSGRGGVGYAFDNGLTPYVSYSESFVPEIGVDFSGNPFVPTTGQQYEAGIKYEPPGENLIATVSVFELTQQNVLTPDPNNPGFEVQAGEVRSQGVELEAVATLDSGWSFIASYTYLDQKVTESNGTDLGNRLTGIPEHTASFWGGYAFDGNSLDGLELGAGVRYIGSSVGDTANTFNVPAVTLFDASARYDLGQVDSQLTGMEVSLNASNVTDETYVASCLSADRCFYGIGRSILAGLTFEW